MATMEHLSWLATLGIITITAHRRTSKGDLSICLIELDATARYDFEINSSEPTFEMAIERLWEKTVTYMEYELTIMESGKITHRKH